MIAVLSGLRLGPPLRTTLSPTARTRSPPSPAVTGLVPITWAVTRSSLLLAGSWTSVVGAIEVAVIALFVGAIPGVLSVYLGRAFEWVTLRLIDTLIALPFLLVAVAGDGAAGQRHHSGAAGRGRAARARLLPGLAGGRALGCPLAVRRGGADLGGLTGVDRAPPRLVQGASADLCLDGLHSRRRIHRCLQPELSRHRAWSPRPRPGAACSPPTSATRPYQPWAPVAPAVLIVVTVWACNLLADTIRDVSGEAGRVYGNAPAETPQAARSLARRCVMVCARRLRPDGISSRRPACGRGAAVGPRSSYS